MYQAIRRNKILICLSLVILLTIPVLNNVHYDPLPQFWAEITLAWVIIALFTIALLNFKQLSLPSIAIPLIFFSLFLIAQPYFKATPFVGLNYVTSLELILCLFLAIFINTIAHNYGLSFMVRCLSYSLLTGALLQSLIGLIQYTGTTHYFGDLIFYDAAHATSNIFGHFGQRNHYAHYLTWGVFGLIYLHYQRRIKSWLFYPLMIWLAFSLSIAASRSVLVYFAVACFIGLIFYLSKRNKSSSRLFLIIITASTILFTIEYFYPLISHFFSQQNNISSGLQRLDTDSGMGRRGIEWLKAWMVFKQSPLLGIGWNNFAQQSVILHPLFKNAPLNDGLFTNCHNLILQLLAETGLIGTLPLIIGVCYTLYRFLRANYHAESIVILCMLATTLTHSMNEYPLWYLYFLAGLVIFLSLDRPLYLIKTSKLLKACGLIIILAYTYLMVQGSIIFDKLVYDYDTPDSQTAFNQQAHYLENLGQHNLLWSYYAFFVLDNYINVNTSYTDQLFSKKQQYTYTKRFSTFRPYPDSLIKQAMLAWDLNKPDEAKQLVSLAVIAYPVYKSSFRSTLKAKQYKALRELIH